MEKDAKQNTEPAEAEVDDTSSGDQQLNPITDDDGLVSTMEYETSEPEQAEPEQAEGEEADSKKETPSEKTEPKTKDTTSKKEGFHDHPRFKQLIEEKNSYKEKYEALQKQGAKQQPTFRNIMDMEDDAIMDEFTDNPKQFLGNFAQQLIHEIDQRTVNQKQQEQQKTIQQKAENTLAEFFSDKKDGQQMLTDGRIQQYIQDNPGHNAISAYHALAGDSQVQDQIDKAVEAERAKIKKELKAAGNANSFSSSPSSKETPKSPEFKNPDKYGGTAAVLLKRFRERQAG